MELWEWQMRKDGYLKGSARMEWLAMDMDVLYTSVEITIWDSGLMGLNMEKVSMLVPVDLKKMVFGIMAFLLKVDSIL